VRRTLGFHKGTDAISLTQFAHGITTRDGRVLDKGCGITSRATLVRALTALEKKGLISARKGRNGAGGRSVTVYGLSWMPGGAGGDPSGVVPIANHLGRHGNQGGSLSRPTWFAQRTRVVRQQNPQQTVLQQTVNTTGCQHARRARASPAVLACIPRGDALDGAALWQAVIDDLRGTMTRENLTMWFASAHVVAREEDVLRVVCRPPCISTGLTGACGERWRWHYSAWGTAMCASPSR
jgi:hypothetical protein